jgi:hypothetical protein
MKKYYIDKRVLVNGKISNISTDNKINLTSLVEKIVLESGGGGGSTTFIDSDNRIYKDEFGGNINFEFFGAPNFEGYLKEVYVDADNNAFHTIFNTQNSGIGGNGDFAFLISSNIRQTNNVGGVTNSYISQFGSEVEHGVAHNDVTNDLNFTTSSRISSDGGWRAYQQVDNTLTNIVNVNRISLSDGNVNKVSIGSTSTDLNTNDSVSKLMYQTATDVGMSIESVDNAIPITHTMSLFLRHDPTSAVPIQLLLEEAPVFADNAAAILGGLVTNAIYKTVTGELRIVI